MQQDQLNQDAIDAERADLTRFTEEKNNEILGYNNEVCHHQQHHELPILLLLQLAHLQTMLEKTQSEAMKWLESNESLS